MLVAVARSCWFLDPFCVDGMSIHRKLDNSPVLFLFLCIIRLGWHTSCGLTELRFMSA